jgi:hypothetical protein
MTHEDEQTFVSAVLECFEPLRGIGYEVIDVRATRVEFAKRLRRVVICRTREGEFDVELGSRTTPFSLEEYLRERGGEPNYRNENISGAAGWYAVVEATAMRLFANPEALLLLDLQSAVTTSSVNGDGASAAAEQHANPTAAR